MLREERCGVLFLTPVAHGEIAISRGPYLKKKKTTGANLARATNLRRMMMTTSFDSSRFLAHTLWVSPSLGYEHRVSVGAAAVAAAARENCVDEHVWLAISPWLTAIFCASRNLATTLQSSLYRVTVESLLQ